METRPAFVDKDQSDQSEAIPLAPLLPELHPPIVSFLYSHEAAKLGEVCRFFHKVTRAPQSHYRKLPYEPRHYAKKKEPLFFQFANHNQVGSKAVLSDNKIAFMFRWGLKLKIIDLIGYDAIATVHEEAITFESARELPPTSIFPFLAEVAGKLVVGSNHSDVFKVFDRTPSHELTLIKTVNTTFVNQWTPDDFGYLIPLQGNKFVAVRPHVLKVFDLDMPAGKEYVRTVTSDVAWTISALPNNQLIRRVRDLDDNVLDILDISQAEGTELVRKITLKDPIGFHSVLSSGRVAICSTQNTGTVTLSIIDLGKPEGEEVVHELPIKFDARVRDFKCLPGEHVGFLLANKNRQISIYDCSPASGPVFLATHSQITKTIDDSITVLKDGRLIGCSSSGDIWLNYFPRITELALEPEGGQLTPGIKK